MKTFVKKQGRNAGIDLLKIIAMFLIIISHSLPRYGQQGLPYVMNFNFAMPGWQNLLLYLFYYFGQIGNCIFVVCSAYFLVDSKRARSEKVWEIIADTFVFSILWLIIAAGAGVTLSGKEIIAELFPIAFENNWFIGCYLIYYIMHPLLNHLIRLLDQRSFLMVNIVGIFLYSIMETMLSEKYFYSKLIGFVLIYFIVAYIKLYLPRTADKVKLNLSLFVAASVLLFLTILVTRYVGLRFQPVSTLMLYWCKFNNPLIIVMAISAFLLFRTRHFISRIVNEASSLSLLIYVIHENILFVNHGKPKIWQYIYENWSFSWVAGWTVLFALICFLVSLAGAWIYKQTLKKPVMKLVDRIDQIWKKMTDKMVQQIMELK